MKEYKLAETEEKFAELIWQNEPIGSGDLVKLAKRNELEKVHNIYSAENYVKRYFPNEKTIVSSIITKEEYYAKQRYVLLRILLEGLCRNF